MQDPGFSSSLKDIERESCGDYSQRYVGIPDVGFLMARFYPSKGSKRRKRMMMEFEVHQKHKPAAVQPCSGTCRRKGRPCQSWQPKVNALHTGSFGVSKNCETVGPVIVFAVSALRDTSNSGEVYGRITGLFRADQDRSWRLKRLNLKKKAANSACLKVARSVTS
jgi:hypothetical protein